MKKNMAFRATGMSRLMTTQGLEKARKIENNITKCTSLTCLKYLKNKKY